MPSWRTHSAGTFNRYDMIIHFSIGDEKYKNGWILLNARDRATDLISASGGSTAKYVKMHQPPNVGNKGFLKSNYFKPVLEGTYYYYFQNDIQQNV